MNQKIRQQNDEDMMWAWTLDMCLAAYLSRDPDSQVRKMARKYKKETRSKKRLKTLKLIIKSSHPAKLVKLAYDDLVEN